MAALEQQRIDGAQGRSLGGCHMHTCADELDLELMVLVGLWTEVLARAGVCAFCAHEDAPHCTVSTSERGIHSSILLYLDILQVLPPVYVVCDSWILQQGLSKPKSAHASPIVGRDPELCLQRLEIEKQEIPRILLRDLGINLTGIHPSKRLLIQQLPQESQRPMQRDRPALIARIGRLVSLVDLEGDVGLSAQALVQGHSSHYSYSRARCWLCWKGKSRDPVGWMRLTLARPWARVRPTTPAPMMMTGF